MDRYAVVGHPVAHSRSPLIHRRFAEACGQTMSYEAIPIAPGEFSARLTELHAQGYRGLSVTLPFKAEACALALPLSARAQAAGAVNTLIATADGWSGDNTDGIGLVSDLQRLAIALRGKRVLLLGAGGAARGVIGALLAEGPRELTVANRNPWKPEALAAAFKDAGPIRPCTFLALKGDRYDLVINATSAGHSAQAPVLPSGLLEPDAVAYDLSYGPAFAPFAAWAQAQGLPVHDGLGMLVAQAVEAFERWRGVRPEPAVALAVLNELRAERR